MALSVVVLTLGVGLTACGGGKEELVAISGVDHAFQGVPKTLDAGEVRFSFENKSEKEEHEMAIVRINDDVKEPFEDLLDLPEEEAMKKVNFVGVGFAEPGQRSGFDLIGNLKAGRYGMVCFIPVGGEQDAPPHFTRGMFAEFTVE